MISSKHYLVFDMSGLIHHYPQTLKQTNVLPLWNLLS